MVYLFLSKPSVVYRKHYIEMIEEWKKAGEEPVPWVLKLAYHHFEEMVQNLQNLSQGINLPKGQVACNTFWLVRSDGKIVGAVNIRHKLSPRLADFGGHIGYGIRPSLRGKGYGRQILRLALMEAKNMGLRKIRITCDEDNAASEKIILKCGGVFDSKGFENGKIIKRFWINV